MNRIEELFEKYDNEALEFDRIESKLSQKADIHAMILISSLGFSFRGGDIVKAARRDTIFLSTDHEAVLTMTDEVALQLVRCGVSYSTDEGFWMFV